MGEKPMDRALDSLISRYSFETTDDYENALKEIVQHLALLGLWRTKFFQHAAFYGGTALRIFYNLQRFSEDMDFSLLEFSDQFELAPYLEAIKKELESFGFEIEVVKKLKVEPSQIESAFIKGNTIKNLILIKSPQEYLKKLPKNKKLQVKLEVDTNPPPKANYEVKTVLTPIPFQVKLFSQPDLFAGKLHAVLCRQWQTRVKGRDFYDYLWYQGHKIPCHLDHLKERMIQTGHWHRNQAFGKKQLNTLLTEKFNKVNFQAAKMDVSPFIKDQQELALWNKTFFLQTIQSLIGI
jgi:predicted nucleotidyltransferase component of viral defense system